LTTVCKKVIANMAFFPILESLELLMAIILISS